MSTVIATHNPPTSQPKTLAKRPTKPLLKLFRKNKPEPLNDSRHEQHQLGSGLNAVVPANPMLKHDPYNPSISPAHASIVHPPPFSVVHNIARKAPLSPSDYYPPPPFIPSSSKSRPQYPKSRKSNRQRSKSVGRDPSTGSSTSRLLEEREQALNKLCGNSPLTSLTDSLPLLSPTYSSSSTTSNYCGGGNSSSSSNSKQETTAAMLTKQQWIPPVPPVPQLQHYNNPTQSHGIRKFASAHDLRKANRIQQEQVRSRAQEEPLPSSQHDWNKMKKTTLPRNQNDYAKKHRNDASSSSDDDDDNIPIGYLAQSPVSPLLNSPSPSFTRILDRRTESNGGSNSEVGQQRTIADEYKEKVKEQLQVRCAQDDDDEIPISFLTLKAQ